MVKKIKILNMLCTRAKKSKSLQSQQKRKISINKKKLCYNEGHRLPLNQAANLWRACWSDLFKSKTFGYSEKNEEEDVRVLGFAVYRFEYFGV